MTTRKVLAVGEVEDIDKGRFWVSFTIKTDNGGRMSMLETGPFASWWLRPGQRVEFVRVKHSLLRGKIRWTDESVKVVKRPPGAGK